MVQNSLSFTVWRKIVYFGTSGSVNRVPNGQWISGGSIRVSAFLKSTLWKRLAEWKGEYEKIRASCTSLVHVMHELWSLSVFGSPSGQGAEEWFLVNVRWNKIEASNAVLVYDFTRLIDNISACHISPRAIKVSRGVVLKLAASCLKTGGRYRVLRYVRSRSCQVWWGSSNITISRPGNFLEWSFRISNNLSSLVTVNPFSFDVSSRC